MIRFAFAIALIAGTAWFIYLLARFFANDTKETKPEPPTQLNKPEDEK